MKLLSQEKLRSIINSEYCPNCQEKLLKNKVQFIKVTTKICFLKCNLCKSAFKLIIREMKHPRDLYIYEVAHNDGETNYSIKGYHINKATFEKNYRKFQLKKNYAHFLFSEEEFLIDS